jgi:hypothetical protein
MPSICDCIHHTAENHLRALAAVFEEAGDYAAAECCQEWATRARQVTPEGQRMALALLYGKASGWSVTR